MNVIEIKKKSQKAEDFIGWKSPDGKLEVIGIIGKNPQGNAIYKVTCTECSKDPELFPDGYFVSLKGNLFKNQKPCGCGKNVRWSLYQYMVLVRRVGEGRFTVNGVVGEFKDGNTKVTLECVKDGHVWSVPFKHIIGGRKSGCPECGGTMRTTEKHALQKCTIICEEMNYKVIGFPDGYQNQKSSFEYICPVHGKQSVRYSHFVYSGSRCPVCWKERQIEVCSGFYGYYPERKDEQDFLYVLNFNDQFIKVGRSFDVDDRIGNLRTASKIKLENIYKLRIFTATHQEIYDFEQELHEELRERGFQYHVDWSTECFENDSLFILNKLLDTCGYERIY